MGGNEYEKDFILRVQPGHRLRGAGHEGWALLTIDCTAVENEVTNSMYQRSELDWLIHNDPLAYAELILNGDPVRYLKTVADSK